MPIRERNPQDAPQGASRERERAETMALNMIAFLMGDEERADGFFGTTGLAPDDLRAGVGQPAFLGGVMDYLLEREDLLVTFCADNNIDPMQPIRVRQALP
jgi:hypothetical protein